MIILSHGYFLDDDEKESLIMKPYVPLGILYISAFLESKSLAHEVYDSTFSSYEKFTKHVLEKKPTLIAFYTNLMTKLTIIKLIGFIKNSEELKHCKIILGGPEIRYNAENYLLQGADLLVVGEGEETFYEVCSSFLKTGRLLLNLNGTAYLTEQKKVEFNSDRPLLKDLDSLPMPARKNVNLALYGEAWKKHHGYSMFSISTMRGCPYTCKWCSRAVFGGTYRRRSAKLVLDEMQYLFENYKPDRLWFVDDVFTINHKWLRQFRDEVLARNLIIPYEIITRADRMNDEVISILKETGCFRVWIGAESGSQKIIDAMDRRVDVQIVRKMIIDTKKAGMEAGTFIMLGYPGEKRSDIKKTIEHLTLSDPSSYTITVAYPIAGTPLFEEVSPTMNAKNTWDKITDRDYDFSRGHSARYYRNAVRWVHNEVKVSKADNVWLKVKHRSYSLISQGLMFLS